MGLKCKLAWPPPTISPAWLVLPLPSSWHFRGHSTICILLFDAMNAKQNVMIDSWECLAIGWELYYQGSTQHHHCAESGSKWHHQPKMAAASYVGFIFVQSKKVCGVSSIFVLHSLLTSYYQHRGHSVRHCFWFYNVNDQWLSLHTVWKLIVWAERMMCRLTYCLKIRTKDMSSLHLACPLEL